LPNIVRVVDDGLCTGCGTCAGICPVDAVSMHVSGGLYLPEVADGCTDCGLCLKCCSGYSANLNELESIILEGKQQDSIIGNFIGCYIGHSNNEDTLNDSTSGGVVTEMLVYALEKGLIDGALVVRMRKDKPLEPEPFVARSREEIVSASKAKYCPVPMNVALKTILSEEGKFGVVGLPCHIYGLRKAEAALPQLKNRIALHIGLFCGHPASFSGTDCLLRKFGVGKDQVEKLDYRGNGWPSRMSIRLKDGGNLSVRFNRGWDAYWNVFSPFLFAPIRCIMCGNQFNELSDVSFGDAWLPELRRSEKGESVIVVRTASANELLTRMKHEAVISLRSVSRAKVKESQAFSLNFKRDNLAGRLAFLRLVGKKTPNMNSKLSFPALAEACLSYLSYRFSSSEQIGFFLAYVPLPLFRLYFGLFKCAFLLSK
jgi:coenzyme F420 hydrogenase subunit beta